ncbi:MULTISPECIES: hypothetical protein [Streptomyces]|uniref:hypothetical protein n=1 Tax=Streptomyces TaxID=1883 RepID=UPI001E2E61C3|nr:MULTISPECIES: hypothetical protein [Streptomyces]UFQ16450.1 hypothetical protein J2N69_16355 [Streptomyces huasconensis]WCL86052.1 hypothetical protein PPN52_16365 [Streptomyces sp. JCM 35825]
MGEQATKPLRLKASKEYGITLTDDEWSTLAAMILIQRERSTYPREIDLLRDAWLAIAEDRETGTVWFRGSELHWIGAMNVAGHRYTDQLVSIGHKILAQLESVEV